MLCINALWVLPLLTRGKGMFFLAYILYFYVYIITASVPLLKTHYFGQNPSFQNWGLKAYLLSPCEFQSIIYSTFPKQTNISKPVKFYLKLILPSYKGSEMTNSIAFAGKAQ